MSDLDANKRKAWCIVVADDHGPEYVPSIAGAGKTSAVQYCGFGEPTTLLQRTLHRAKQIAPTAQIAVTVREENREHWEPALWFIRPERRFVSDSRMASSLAAGSEKRLPADMCREVPRSVLRSLRWWPPTFPQRAFRVHRCGWRGLHTARAVSRISASSPATVDSVPQHLAEPDFQSRRTSQAMVATDFCT